MGGGAFEADLGFDIKPAGIGHPVRERDMVIKPRVVHGEVSAQEGGVSGKDDGEGDVGAADFGDGGSAHPLMEVGDDGAACGLGLGDGAEELLHAIAEGSDLVDEGVVTREADIMMLPQEVFDPAQLGGGGGGIQENHAGATGDQPVTVVGFDALFAKRIQYIAHEACGLGFLEFRL